MTIGCYYKIPFERNSLSPIPYDVAKEKLATLLEASVKRRLVADVPLGAFLSGGIDSSVVVGLASKHKPDLHTFSIGFRDEKFFDETQYARLVAKHFNTQHTVFSLTNDDLYRHVHSILDCIDEPFADSSAIAVYILSQETRKLATVALSGDGADELLAGYNKHEAFLKSFQPGLKENAVTKLLPLWKAFPTSRNNPISNKIRQLKRFGEGMKLTPKERYWQWARFANETEVHTLLSSTSMENFQRQEYESRKSEILKTIPSDASINDVLLTDMNLVLPNDMLAKVDMMSMANSLEVRVPFLDFEVVNFIFSLPGDFKINSQIRKRILQDTFKALLPAQLYNRPKKGFEVPLLKWFRKEMKSLIVDDLLSKKLIDEQGIFDYTEIEKLKTRLFSSNPGDIHARIWGLVVFQWWWKKNFKF